MKQYILNFTKPELEMILHMVELRKLDVKIAEGDNAKTDESFRLHILAQKIKKKLDNDESNSV